MLYRLDLATPYQSIPALLQHFMDSSPYNGVIEMRLVTTPVASTSDPSLVGESSTPGPTQSAGGTPPPFSGLPEETSTSNSPPRNSGPQNASDYSFDPLFAFAPSDISANPSAPAPSSSAIPYGQSSEYGATAYPTPPPMTRRGRQAPPRPISPPFMFPHPQASLRPPPPPVIRKRFPPRTTLVWAFVPLVQRYLAAGAGTLLFECRSYTTPPSPYASYGGDDPSLDIIAQGGPYKRMVGYVGRLFDGGLAVYELADSVAATTAMDSVMLMGMAGVEAVGRGPAIAERGLSHNR
ncbi:hypothetical protein RSOL_412020 [Rhizoctonia solani AG-3 Rhs1AP]|uniref:Uncharacterized protein n=2 Tax=Rhizoctonia solani AG-3 TaxID=1086053 RepID=A0A074S0X7_9AGAM|nr:hypothetical protein RSOL_412020 [Rhizoctonia solani AG-3 Rhs1AP]KEP53001.1 hypothetical protein V565_036560 [Rhizoctonia solani 123E]